MAPAGSTGVACSAENSVATCKSNDTVVRPLSASRYGLELVELTFFIEVRTGEKVAPAGSTGVAGNIATRAGSISFKLNGTIVRPFSPSK